MRDDTGSGPFTVLFTFLIRIKAIDGLFCITQPNELPDMQMNFQSSVIVEKSSIGSF